MPKTVLSRQRRWQQKKLDEGLCKICGSRRHEPSKTVCRRCQERARDRARLRDPRLRRLLKSSKPEVLRGLVQRSLQTLRIARSQGSPQDDPPGSTYRALKEFLRAQKNRKIVVREGVAHGQPKG